SFSISAFSLLSAIFFLSLRIWILYHYETLSLENKNINDLEPNDK
ncbi:hypothetical protein GUU_02883, partial [Malacoplasma iowae 695]